MPATMTPTAKKITPVAPKPKPITSAPAQPRKPAATAMRPVLVECEGYSKAAGAGILRINDVSYTMTANRTNGKTVGVTLTKFTGTMIATYTVDMTRPAWTCTCPDAMYRPRAEGCKHCQALRTVAKQLQGKAE